MAIVCGSKTITVVQYCVFNVYRIYGSVTMNLVICIQCIQMAVNWIYNHEFSNVYSMYTYTWR